MAYATLPQKSLSDSASDRSSALIARAEIRKERVLDDSSVSCWNIRKIDDEIRLISLILSKEMPLCSCLKLECVSI